MRFTSWGFVAAVECATLMCISSTEAWAAPPCALPNNISNGQVADASKVMENFEAVADCAEAAISPTGTPVTGGIAVFSGTGTITSGDLTGDVTTSGGTASTLSNSGVTPGVYTSANIIVDAKGRVTSATNGSGGGGGGGQAWWFEPPAAADFTSTQGTIGTASDDLQVGAILPMGTPVLGDVTRAFLKPIPNPSGDWWVEMGYTTTGAVGNYAGFGLVMIYSGGSRSHLWRNGVSNTGFSTTRLNLPSGFSSNPNGITKPASFPEFMKIQKVGGNLEFYFSSDGKVWVLAATESATSWLTSPPDLIGPGGFYNRNWGPVTLSIQYWKQSW